MHQPPVLCWADAGDVPGAGNGGDFDDNGHWFQHIHLQVATTEGLRQG